MDEDDGGAFGGRMLGAALVVYSFFATFRGRVSDFSIHIMGGIYVARMRIKARIPEENTKGSAVQLPHAPY
jgi:hypothetical protein